MQTLTCVCVFSGVMQVSVHICIYIISFMFRGQTKTAQNVPCDHHVTILFFLFAYVECNVLL